MKCYTKDGFSTLEAERAKPAENLYGNNARLDSLYQRQRTPSQPPAPARVDRTDRATVLHNAYLQALKGKHEQE